MRPSRRLLAFSSQCYLGNQPSFRGTVWDTVVFLSILLGIMGLGETTRSSLVIVVRSSSQRTRPSIMESVAQLDKDFARVVPMKASESLAVVKFDAAVGHVQSIQ